MRYIIALTLLLVFSADAFSKKQYCEDEIIGDWTVSAYIDDFEGEAKVTLSSSIKSLEGSKIGKINMMVANLDRWEALVSMNIPGLDSSWPACDYDFTKYRIDNRKSNYFPKIKKACSVLFLNKPLKEEFKRGKTLRMSAEKVVGESSLLGFAKAWDTSARILKNNRCVRNKEEVDIVSKAHSALIARNKNLNISFLSANVYVSTIIVNNTTEKFNNVCGEVAYTELSGEYQEANYLVIIADEEVAKIEVLKPEDPVNKVLDHYCKPNEENIFVESRQAFKKCSEANNPIGRLKCSDSLIFSEKVVDNGSERKATCGKIGIKGNHGTQQKDRNYFISGDSFRMETPLSKIDSEIWKWYCTDKVQKKAIKKWTKHYNGKESVFATTSKNATLYMKCGNNDVPTVYQDLQYDVMSEKGRGFLGLGKTRNTQHAIMQVVGRKSKWKMIDNNSLMLPLKGRSMKHVANMLRSPTIFIEGTSTKGVGTYKTKMFNNYFAKDGFKESLQELKAVCPNSAWDKYLGDLLD